MEKFIAIVTTLLWCNFVVCQHCIEPTFVDHSIEIELPSKKTFQTVTGCITSKNVVYDNLKTIKVSGQSIPELKKGAVFNIPQWFGLIFINNNIIRINSEAFIDINVNSITLTRNGIQWIEPNAMSNLPSLEVIDLEYNRIAGFKRNTFVNLPNLTTISFSYNHLDYFDQCWFHQTPKLEDLFLDNNDLWTIPKNAFSKLQALKRVTLENNFIEHVHKDAFAGVEHLIELYLTNNRIKELNIDFSGFNNFQFFAIDKNFLTYLSLQDLQHVTGTLRNMYIHANPWQCSCLQQFLEWGTKNKVSLFWECKNESLTCVVPDKDPEKCSVRPDSHFNNAARENFNRDCKRITHL